MNYCLLYHPNMPLHYVTPVLKLDGLIAEINQVLTIPRNEHTAGHCNNLARAVRVNWMVEDLKYNRIVKPLVLNLRYFMLTTITGDTRLQAAELSPHITSMSALLTIKEYYREQFPDWEVVQDINHLAEMMKIPANKILFPEGVDNWTDQELDWIEFDLQETSTHMHDEDQRLRMMYNYLDTQDADFQFTQEWFQTLIDWNQYDF